MSDRVACRDDFRKAANPKSRSDRSRLSLFFQENTGRVSWTAKACWRLKTYAEISELLNDCIWEWTIISGVYGYKVYGKKPGYTDKWIFLPLKGCKTSTYNGNTYNNGGYWSASLAENRAAAWSLWLDQVNRNVGSGSERTVGFYVRAVAAPVSL